MSGPRLSPGTGHDRIEQLRKQAFDLTPHEQYRLATFIAENVGYLLTGEPEHPDSPHASNDKTWTPEEYWEYVGGLTGEFERDQMRDMLAESVPATLGAAGYYPLHGLAPKSGCSRMTILFSRCFAMPNAATFSVKPIGEFVHRYLAGATVSVDPFARNRDWATYTNDINPSTSAQSHHDAEAFMADLASRGITADLALFDPPYSPRQVSEHYRAAGRQVTGEDTQNGRLYRRVRNAIDRIIEPGGIVLSFGWQSVGMGIGRGYELIEVMMVTHGGGHNDTLCIAERKSTSDPSQNRGAQ
jgi:hypothetical protein